MVRGEASVNSFNSNRLCSLYFISLIIFLLSFLIFPSALSSRLLLPTYLHWWKQITIKKTARKGQKTSFKKKENRGKLGAELGPIRQPLILPS